MTIEEAKRFVKEIDRLVQASLTERNTHNAPNGSYEKEMNAAAARQDAKEELVHIFSHLVTEGEVE